MQAAGMPAPQFKFGNEDVARRLANLTISATNSSPMGRQPCPLWTGRMDSFIPSGISTTGSVWQAL
jgi:hypothetical protein